MKASIQFNAGFLALASSFTFFTLTLAASKLFQPAPETSSVTNDALVVPCSGTAAHQGYELYMLNCAHCHGSDARGDEGPDLHGVTKSNARIASLIKNGSKGEMPKFRTKLTDAEVQALVAFVRSLP